MTVAIREIEFFSYPLDTVPVGNVMLLCFFWFHFWARTFVVLNIPTSTKIPLITSVGFDFCNL